MINTKIADMSDLESIARFRVEQQIEDWNKTNPGRDYSKHYKEFYSVTKEYLVNNLNKTIYFAMTYLDNRAVAMCALEKSSELPQITICEKPSSLHGSIVSVYTKPEYRCRGYQQALIKMLLRFASDTGFTDITLTTNTEDAKHIYKKAGFRYISDKFYLAL